MPSEMKAAYILEKGPPENLIYGERPVPRPNANEVLVKIYASAVNPIDTYVRSGIVNMDLPFPYIPGCDFAGRIEEVGRDVKKLKIGDRVWGSNQGVYGRQGTLAEFAVVDEMWAYPIPNGVDDRSAAGARVITTVGNAAKQRLCESWGADLVLNYHSKHLDADIDNFAANTGGIKLWIETQRELSFERIVTLMAPHGRIVLMAGAEQRPELPIGPFYFKELRLLGLLMMKTTAEEQQKSALAINNLFEAGKFCPPVGRIFPLTEAACAHSFQEQNTLAKSGELSGKIIVLPGGG
jgi:NADPH2:quinone reductase